MSDARENAGVDELVLDLAEHGFVWVRGRLLESADACRLARKLIDACSDVEGLPALELVGSFVLPPPDGLESRDFQTLHFDFGLPLDPASEVDVGRFTALHIPFGFKAVSAVTRLVPLAPLLAQRAWPGRAELIDRLVAYGETHGAWDSTQGYVEGSLARLVEAAAGSRLLPSVRAEPGFLCGTEFDSALSETRFLEQHGLRVDAVEVDVALSPGELLVFDNLAVAHGRRGGRRPGELHQWVFGAKAAGLSEQRRIRDRVLAAFDGADGLEAERILGEASVP
jgi:hypothetical protein